MPIYDCIIVGSGPAGIEAAVNLKIRNKNFLIFGSKQVSDKVFLAPKIDNYLGFPGITGEELCERFKEHIAKQEIEIIQKQIITIYEMGGYFTLATADETFEANTILLAIGISNSKTLPRESEMLGRGISYCATCDAPLYKGKTVAVFGFNEEAVEEANFLSEIAEKVYFLPFKKLCGKLNPGIDIIEEDFKGFLGEEKITGFLAGDNAAAVDGIFIIRDTIAPEALMPGVETSEGYIKVDKVMMTNINGCFAAGDCTGKPHQYMIAAGQGQMAAHGIIKYLV